MLRRQDRFYENTLLIFDYCIFILLVFIGVMSLLNEKEFTNKISIFVTCLYFYIFF